MIISERAPAVRAALVNGVKDGVVPKITGGRSYLLSRADGSGGLEAVWVPLSASAGTAGASGATGPAGATGSAGTVGATGTVGAAGSAGPAGAIGTAGTGGAAGGTGATGPAGSAGVSPIGATGPQGAAGVSPIGATGPEGSAGVAGVIGATGPVGASGVSPIGAIGPTGATGPIGATGATGPREYFWASSSIPATTSARYLQNDTTVLTATEGLGVLLGAGGTLTLMRVDFAGTAMSTANMTFTLRVNGVDSALTVTINAGATSGQMTGASVAINPGDSLSMKSVASASEANSAINLLITAA